MSKPAKRTTRLCGYDADNIMIRNRNLVTDLKKKVSFTQMISFRLLGDIPEPSRLRAVDAVLITIMEHGLTPSAIASR